MAGKEGVSARYMKQSNCQIRRLEFRLLLGGLGLEIGTGYVRMDSEREPSGRTSMF